ncbi:MAG: chlorite dismutase family protein [Actinomycetota bacterium]|nr:chlorite dismutase family protein [Actinomycetota bacterium]
MSDSLIFASYPVFKVLADHLDGIQQDVATKEVAELLDSWSDLVEVRGVYSTAAFKAGADLMFWWISESADDHQRLLIEFRRTMIGRALTQTHAFLGLVRPAEFSKDHQPAFVQGKSPKKYACVYPFVRTPEWYLLEPSKRAGLLREHGGGGREYPDVLANTTSAFGLGDYEWILTFEADSLDRIVELIRRLRATEARRYTALEVPFVTGIRKELHEAIGDLF